MSFRFTSVLAASLALGTLLAAPDAAAYCRSTTCTGDCAKDDDDCKIDGAKLFWPGMCVGFSLNSDASEFVDLETMRDVVTKGFVAWSDIDCSGAGDYVTIAFQMQDDVPCRCAQFNKDGPNANIVLFQDTKWIYKGVDNTLAKTTVTYDTDTGEIFDADIELNHAYNEFTISDEDVVYDLQSIVTHEVGHFIGLDHTQDFVATMNAGYQQGTIELRTIESDDEDAVCDAYPPSRNVQCSFTPRGGFGWVEDGEAVNGDEGGCSYAPAGGDPQRRWAALLLLGLMGLRRRR
jgi:MYXO-CTERM domain-containing protein